MPTPTENITLDDVEARIRAREEEAHPADTTILSAILYARRASGMGLHLENACPYVRTRSEREACEPVPASTCVGRENYRECPIYKTTIVLEDLASLEPFAP
ncbi:MAG: hypothetical protein KKF56_01840 [Nanoarchaeota archaeon]|nr:hypothetical protein [Nanoarchaeota archaeon]